MTLYVLPDGIKVEEDTDPGLVRGVGVWVIHPAYGSIAVERDKLTEVPPPRPEPAQDGSFVTVQSEGVKEWAFSRREAVRRSMYPDYPAASCWWWHDNGEWVSWRDILGMGDPKRWCPDPAVDAPALPWTSPSCNGDYPDLKVERARDAGDVLEINGTRLSANRIRDLMGICARMLKPGSERDALQSAAYARREASR